MLAARAAGGVRAGGDDDLPTIEQTIAGQASLYDHLDAQLGVTQLTEDERALAAANVAAQSNLVKKLESGARPEEIEQARAALGDAGLDPALVDHVNAHAAGTPAGDAAELAALEALLEGRRGDDALVASTKGATGHLLGAAGALEACFAVLALRDCLAPATAHLAAPLPTSERINLVAEATRRDLRVALSTSSGFGGTNAALVFARADVSGDLGVEARARVPLG